MQQHLSASIGKCVEFKEIKAKLHVQHLRTLNKNIKKQNHTWGTLFIPYFVDVELKDFVCFVHYHLALTKVILEHTWFRNYNFPTCKNKNPRITWMHLECLRAKKYAGCILMWGCASQATVIEMNGWWMQTDSFFSHKPTVLDLHSLCTSYCVGNC